MGVYIKGLEMPITCDDCIVPLSKCDFLQRRADVCPLVEIDDYKVEKTQRELVNAWTVFQSVFKDEKL